MRRPPRRRPEAGGVLRGHRPDSCGDDLDLPEEAASTPQSVSTSVLRDEHDFDGGYTTVKDYVRERRIVYT